MCVCVFVCVCVCVQAVVICAYECMFRFVGVVRMIDADLYGHNLNLTRASQVWCVFVCASEVCVE